MINRRALLVLAVWAGFALLCIVRAHADEGYTCADVRAAVATIKTGASVNEKRAIEILEAMAKGNGVRLEQIAKAKRCLR